VTSSDQTPSAPALPGGAAEQATLVNLLNRLNQALGVDGQLL
jgi:hypothetical protein